MVKILTVVLACCMYCSGHVGQWDSFSLVTPYDWAYESQEPSDNERYELDIDGRTCKAVHVTVLARHGARYPLEDATKQIESLRERLLSLPTGPLYHDVKNWTLEYTPDNAGKLVSEGAKEQYALGQRIGKRFRSLFENKRNYLKFMSSTEQRNTKSSERFYSGLNNTVSGIGPFSNEVNAAVLKYHVDCANYEDKMDLSEYKQYESTPEFSDIEVKLEKSLGIELSPADVYVIYELCSYDKFILNMESFWCNLLSDEERSVLEYGEDILNYYAKSSGHPIVPELTCPLMGDIFKTMDKAVNEAWDYDNLPAEALDQGYLAGKFMDSHNHELLSMMSALGIYKDSQPLLASNRNAMSNRLFKTSKISPFSGNLGFVLYACNPAVGETKKSFMFQLLANENPVKMPICNSFFCPYNNVRESLSGLIDLCDVNDVCNRPLPVYSTVTTYDWANVREEPTPDAGYTVNWNGETCKAVHVSMLVRHGARYPLEDETPKIQNLRQRLLQVTNGPRFEDIKNWITDFTSENTGKLVQSGASEQFSIGRRTGLKFKTLFENNAQSLNFLSSTQQRNIESSAKFYDGLSSAVSGIEGYQNSINGSLLRFYESCNKYHTRINLEESKAYADTKDFSQLKTKLANSLGLSDLSTDEVYIINDLCAYDKFIHNRTSFWCDLLTDNDRLILEYGRDIERFHTSSSGHPLIPDMTCDLMNNILQTLDEAVAANSVRQFGDHLEIEPLDGIKKPVETMQYGKYMAGKFMDSHVVVILSMMTALGLYKDDKPLFAENRESMTNRNFRTSRIVPFSSNLGFVLYSCESMDRADPSLMLQLLVNEEPVKIPVCDSYFCPYDTVRQSLSGLTNQCNLKDVCERSLPRWDVFSTNTAYNWTVKPEDSSDDYEYEHTTETEECRAVHVSMMVRHGARYPFKEENEVIKPFIEKIRSFPQSPLYENVVNWAYDDYLKKEEQLCSIGAQEQFQIGLRTGKRFKSLFANKGQYLKFMSSTSPRNIDSSREFFKGLTNSVEDEMEFNNEVNGNLLRLYQRCSNYDALLDNTQAEAYRNSPSFSIVRETLQRRLKVSLTADEVYVIYKLCAYDKILSGDESFWCDLLTSEQRDVLEYGRDLESYYTMSKGHTLIPKMACPLLGDIFKTMDKAVNSHWDYESLPEEAFSQGYLAGKFMDSHVTMVVSLMTALGLYDDGEPLTAYNRVSMAGRQFKTSHIGPFSTNVAFVLYACNPKNDITDRTFKMRLMVNEQEVVIPACGSTECSYEAVKEYYRNLLDDCSVSEICNGYKYASSATVVSSATFLISVLLLVVQFL